MKVIVFELMHGCFSGPPKNLNLYPRRESLTVAEGGDILLKCIYNIGLPRADHHWSFTPTGKSFSTTLMKPTSISFNQGAAEMRLDIMNVTKHQSGIYMCSVWSSLYPQKMNKSISIDIICTSIIFLFPTFKGKYLKSANCPISKNCT